MLEAIILYGSKARNDSDSGSDTDLLGVSESGKIQKPFDQNGLSFHVYPLAWMIQQSNDGSLFLLHIVSEGLPLFDPAGLLDDIKRAFSFKASYRGDIETGIRVVAAVLNIDEADFSDKMRSRYFWGLRTSVMAAAAHQGRPAFASNDLEEFSSVDGLAFHIKSRRTATFSQCREFGLATALALGLDIQSMLREGKRDNLEKLFEIGGVATATAGAIVYGA